jgi:hypothetical protein
MATATVTAQKGKLTYDGVEQCLTTLYPVDPRDPKEDAMELE